MANARITLKDIQEKFAAAGVYTLYNDIPAANQTVGGEPIRLVVGFSKIGWFNVPIFIAKGDYKTAEALYGKDDKSLERRGSYFHNSLRVALSEGGVLALNLHALNNEVNQSGVPTTNADVVPYRSFSTDIADINGVKRNKLYASYFRKDRFWTPDKNYLLATRDTIDKTSILNFTNLLKTPTTIIVRKSTQSGFDVTIKDWYSDTTEDQMPPFVRPYDLVSDYLIDVIVISGNYGSEKYKELSVDPLFGNYFDLNGLIRDKLDEFLARPEVIIKQIFTGSLIPKFKDKDGSNYYIESVINNQIKTIGLLCAINTDQLDKYETNTNDKYVDLVGHRLLSGSVSNTDFLSYKKKITQDYLYTKKTTNASLNIELGVPGVSVAYAPKKITVTISNNYVKFSEVSANVALGSIFRGATTADGTAYGITVANPALTVSRLTKLDDTIIFELTCPLKEQETGDKIFVDFYKTVDTPETRATDTATITNAGNTGDTIAARVNNGVSLITLGSYTVQVGDTVDDVATGLSTAIAAAAGTHNYGVSVNADQIVITAPSGTGALANAYVLSFLTTGIVAATASAHMSGGITIINDINYYQTRNRFALDATSTYYIADINAQIYNDYKNGNLTNGDKLTNGTLVHYIKFSEILAINGVDTADDYRNILKVSFFTDSNLTVPIAAGAAIDFGESVDTNGITIVDTTKINFISLIDAINERFDAILVSPKIARVVIANEPKIKMGSYLVGIDADNNSYLTRIIAIRRYGSPSPTHIEIECEGNIKELIDVVGNVQIERYLPIEEIYDRYDLTSLDGFVIKDSHTPNNTNARMKTIYKVMTDSNMADALADPEMIDFRYFVDTFNHGLEPQSKNYLSKMIMKRQKAIGLLNCPTKEEFENSDNPRFTSTPTSVDPLPVLNVDYIRQGGNLEENPQWTYTLPEEADGASFVGFFYSNIEVLDNRNDVVNYPPAAYVSNNFVQKYRTSPFLPAAGPNRGIITGDGVTGVTHPLTMTERGLLQRKGINPIFKKSNGQVQIMGDETAYKKYRSVLNNLSSRDTLISIEIGEESILSPFTFERNDDTNRSTIESLLEDYLKNMRDSFGAITDYDIVFDRTNNPDWLIREGAGLVDTIVELPGIAKRYINRITLKNSGGAVVSSFTAI